MINDPFNNPKSHLAKGEYVSKPPDLPIRIKFENTFADILKFNMFHQFRNIPLQGVFIITCVFVFYNQYIVEIEHGTDMLESIIIACFMYIGLWIFQFVFNVIYLYSKSNHSVLTTHTVELQQHFFYEETPYFRCFYNWNGVVKVVRNGAFIGVYVNPNTAVIIPNRTFSNQKKQCDVFYDSLMKHLKNAT